MVQRLNPLVSYPYLALLGGGDSSGVVWCPWRVYVEFKSAGGEVWCWMKVFHTIIEI